MARHLRVVDDEPVVSTATIVALAAAVLGLLVAFTVPITVDQQKAILGVVGVLAPLVAAWLTRGKVTPAAAVVARVNPDPRRADYVAGPAAEVADGTPVTVVRAA